MLKNVLLLYSQFTAHSRRRWSELNQHHSQQRRDTTSSLQVHLPWWWNHFIYYLLYHYYTCICMHDHWTNTHHGKMRRLASHWVPCPSDRRNQCHEHDKHRLRISNRCRYDVVSKRTQFYGDRQWRYCFKYMFLKAFLNDFKIQIANPAQHLPWRTVMEWALMKQPNRQHPVSGQVNWYFFSCFFPQDLVVVSEVTITVKILFMGNDFVNWTYCCSHAWR